VRVGHHPVVVAVVLVVHTPKPKKM
jgi:hypothetical protein